VTTTTRTTTVEHCGRTVYTFKLQCRDLEVECTNYGATILSVKTRNRENVMEEITLCYATVDELIAHNGGPYYGCIAGRCANRIARGQFTLNEQQYQLQINNGVNHLHGGIVGFNQRVWEAEVVEEPDHNRVGVVFTYTSPDGEEGYPGNLQVHSLSAVFVCSCFLCMFNVV
jgi:aldose 1-epimerase